LPGLPAADFVSYSRDDSDFARQLARDLKAAGARVWLDQLDIPAGHAWDNAVEEALERSPRMLLILSPSSAKSNNVRNEISFALDNRKIIVPVLYRDCAVPLQLRRIQYIDCRTDYQTGLTALVALLAEPPAEEALTLAPTAGPAAQLARSREIDEDELASLRQEAERLRAETERLRREADQRQAREGEARRLREEAEQLRREAERLQREAERGEAELIRQKELLPQPTLASEAAISVVAASVPPSAVETPLSRSAPAARKENTAAALIGRWKGLPVQRRWLIVIGVSRLILPFYAWLKLAKGWFFGDFLSVFNPLDWNPAWLDVHGILYWLRFVDPNLEATHRSSMNLQFRIWFSIAHFSSRDVLLDSLLWSFAILLVAEGAGLLADWKWAQYLVLIDAMLVWIPAALYQWDPPKLLGEWAYLNGSLLARTSLAYSLENVANGLMIAFLLWVVFGRKRAKSMIS
jgi:hypothetical protein